MSQQAQPTLAAVQRRFPDWQLWKGISGHCYGRRRRSPDGTPADGTPAVAYGDTPADLADSITRLEQPAAAAAP